MYTFSKQLWGLHSPSTCSVQNFQIFTGDNFVMLTLSAHVSGFTLHTVIWFTLSKHMLGSKFLDFHERSFCHAYTLHTCFRVHSPYSYLVYTLQAHVRFKIFKYSQKFFFHAYTLHTCLTVHSPYSYLVYTLQAYVRFNIFWIFTGFHLFHTYTLHSCFRVHSPCRCYISKFYILIIISSFA